ncbi:MAG: hypothetical protein IPL75_13625 [Acidobacteria bacterium]|nr:hypothetical protein [Acidobacteriota bacterium]
MDPLKYQANPAVIDRPSRPANTSGDWLTVKARYKQPDGDVSALIEQSVRSGGPVRHLRVRGGGCGVWSHVAQGHD